MDLYYLLYAIKILALMLSVLLYTVATYNPKRFTTGEKHTALILVVCHVALLLW